ncbi:unnamed protein product [Penicillium olsonii]|nr:unnamed protein product [Penicillium olsonii]
MSTLYEGERLALNPHPVVYRFFPAERVFGSLVVFIPGMAHNARISYGGHPGSHAQDFLAYWFNDEGHSFLGLSYPLDSDSLMPATSPDFTIPKWGLQAAAVIHDVIVGHRLPSRVIILAWSMAGKILHPVAAYCRELNIEVELFVSLAATPALPGLLPVPPRKDIVKTAAGYATKPSLEKKFLQQIEEQTNSRSGSERYLHRNDIPRHILIGDQPIIDPVTYKRDYLGATPIGLTASGLRYDTEKNDFVEEEPGKLMEHGQVHDFKNLPPMAAIFASSALDFRHALTDKPIWGHLMIQRATCRLIDEGISDLCSEPGVADPIDFQQLQEAILKIPELMTMEIPGNHFFFVGADGARKTVDMVIILLGVMARHEREIKRILSTLRRKKSSGGDGGQAN